MTPFVSIAKATAREILSEPLSLLVLLASLVLAVFAPAFHYHQFGDPTRMARDAGCSALFLGGTVFAVFGMLRSFRREIETGTFQMALARPVSRSRFFLAKVAGGFVAYAAFAIILFAAMVTMVAGAAVGGEIAEKTGDIARIYGPCLAACVLMMLVPLIFGATLNRFKHFRFVHSCFIMYIVISLFLVVAVGFLASAAFCLRLLAIALPPIAFTAILLAASAAFSVRFEANAAASACAIVVASLLPFVGNYYLPDALSRGGSLPWSMVALIFAVSIPGIAIFLLLGCRLVNRVE